MELQNGTGTDITVSTDPLSGSTQCSLMGMPVSSTSTACLLTSWKSLPAKQSIMPFEVWPRQKPYQLQDYDDDGESAAGGRLLKLLTLVGAENIVVVVSRWYGGVLLGPARFTHINNAARQLLDECGYVSSKQTKSSKKK